jgi:hypothetical protein
MMNLVGPTAISSLWDWECPPSSPRTHTPDFRSRSASRFRQIDVQALPGRPQANHFRIHVVNLEKCGGRRICRHQCGVSPTTPTMGRPPLYSLELPQPSDPRLWVFGGEFGDFFLPFFQIAITHEDGGPTWALTE